MENTVTGGCRRCHRALKDPDSIARGLGPVCAALEAGDKRMHLFGGDSKIKPIRSRGKLKSLRHEILETIDGAIDCLTHGKPFGECRLVRVTA